MHCDILLDVLYELYYDARIHKHKTRILFSIAYIFYFNAFYDLHKGMRFQSYMQR